MNIDYSISYKDFENLNSQNLNNPSIIYTCELTAKYDKERDIVILTGNNNSIETSISEVLRNIKQGTIYISNLYRLKNRINRYISTYYS